jgi:hypothetical protein
MTLSNRYARKLSLLVAFVCALSFSPSAFAQVPPPAATLASESPVVKQLVLVAALSQKSFLCERR